MPYGVSASSMWSPLPPAPKPRPGRRREALGVPKAYGSFEALVADPTVHVVHNTTPNYLHVPVIHGGAGACASTWSRTSRSRRPPRTLGRCGDAARTPACACCDVQLSWQPARCSRRARWLPHGEIGPVHFVHGSYLQDWLLEPTDFSWRLEPDKGGAELGRRRHRLALVRPRRSMSPASASTPCSPT